MLPRKSKLVCQFGEWFCYPVPFLFGQHDAPEFGSGKFLLINSPEHHFQIIVCCGLDDDTGEEVLPLIQTGRTGTGFRITGLFGFLFAHVQIVKRPGFLAWLEEVRLV